MQIIVMMVHIKMLQTAKFFFTLSVTSCITYLMINRILEKDRLNARSLRDFYRQPYINVGPRRETPHQLLQHLGFSTRPMLYPKSYHEKLENLPIFVTSVRSNQMGDFKKMIETFMWNFVNKRLVVYDVGLTKFERLTLLGLCKCQVRSVRWQRYPAHVKRHDWKAYQPILIQDALQEFGLIFWISASTRFHSGNITSIISQVLKTGIVAWPIIHPTSALTHYFMFRFFNASHQNYYFHRMVEADCLVLANLPHIHFNLMLPWIKCVLDADCIAPSGSQPSGCHYNQKPRYLYSGCHRYETSALNVILGQLYSFEIPYASNALIFTIEEQITGMLGWFL